MLRLAAGLVLAAGAVSAQPSSTPGAVRLRAIEPDTARGRAAAVVVESGALVHTAQLWPLDVQGGLHGGNDSHAQARAVLANLDVALRAADTGLDAIARLHVYVSDATVTPGVDRALVEQFAGANRPAVTIVESRMPRPGVLVAMDAIAATARQPAGGGPHRLVVPGLAPLAGGGAHVAVQPQGPFVIVSGRAASGEFAAAAAGTMEQLRGDLTTVGLGFEHVVQVKAFLGDMSRADQLRQIVNATFQGTAPPLIVTEWRDGSLPVEIELVATAPGATDDQRVTFVEPIASRYSRVARIYSGRPIFVSGLSGGAAEPAVQVREVFSELRRLLTAAGSDMRHIAKATYYVSNKAADQEINTIRPSIYDPMRPPAASKISVQGTGQPGKGAVIDVIAVTTAR
jgi:enamine deaminase RidA (YjgF/YER057c/UK114 family)